MELLRRTTSLSPLTNETIDAEVYREGNQVYMVKRDEEGTEYKYLIEKDYDIYHRLADYRPPEDLPLATVLLDVSSRCNLNCTFCYEGVLDDRPELTPQELERYARKYNDKVLGLAGREPTVRDDLAEVVRSLVKHNPSVQLLTNGVRTADYELLKRLQDAGVGKVILQFFGFQKESNINMCGKSVVKQKLATFENCRRLGIPTHFSTTISKDVNEHEIEPMFNFVRGHDFVYDYRLRTCAPVGRHADTEHYFISDLVNIVTERLGFDRRDILQELDFVREAAKTFNVNFIHPKVCSFFFHVKRNPGGTPFPVGRRLRGLNLRRLPFKKLLLPMLGTVMYGFPYMSGYAVDRLRGNITLRSSIVPGLLRISLRSWPNVYNIDLEENRKCVTGYLKHDRIEKFCLRNIKEGNVTTKKYSFRTYTHGEIKPASSSTADQEERS